MPCHTKKKKLRHRLSSPVQGKRVGVIRGNFFAVYLTKKVLYHSALHAQNVRTNRFQAVENGSPIGRDRRGKISPAAQKLRTSNSYRLVYYRHQTATMLFKGRQKWSQVCTCNEASPISSDVRAVKLPRMEVPTVDASCLVAIVVISQ